MNPERSKAVEREVPRFTAFIKESNETQKRARRELITKIATTENLLMRGEG
jgi:hypothetical protein